MAHDSPHSHTRPGTVQHLLRPLLALILVGMLSACASTQSSTPRVRHDPNHITQEEIQAIFASNAFEVVQRLRPRWLEVRGVDSFRQASSIVVYVDNVRVGGTEALRQINITHLRELRFLDAVSATRLYGTGHGAGAILVRTR